MNPILPLTEKDRKRFWAKVERRDGECWPWLGSVHQNYRRGRFMLRGNAVFAPRVAWAIANGREPDGLVLHSCDNANCVNPAHLRVGTIQENIMDRTLRGRQWQAGVTHCKHGHEFTPENTGKTSLGYRRCLTCHREWHHRNKQAQEA